eukprot:GHVR01163524.1.p1 GENE.GHVR01163524.1~~GHVR01163524.1.p1  ORF type:complete len:197 (+),score=28.69 GHVR01163524.1:72-662(+)
MIRDDVPWDIAALLQGQALLIEAQIADLLVNFVTLTLKQRDILLQNVPVSEKEKEALRRLPLFEKELFPVDFETLELRINSQRTREQKLAMFTELARSLRLLLLWPLHPLLSRQLSSRLSGEEEEVNNSLEDMHSSPEGVSEVAVAGAEAPSILHLTLRGGIFGVATGARPENDLLSILSEEGLGTSCQDGSVSRT